MAVQTAVITQRELQEIHDLEEDLRTKQAELDRMKDNVKTFVVCTRHSRVWTLRCEAGIQENAKCPVEEGPY
jgi:hypothetical protein